MATRDTTTPASTPPSPSPRADAAPWVSETPGRSPDVVGIVDRQRCPQHVRPPPPSATSEQARCCKDGYEYGVGRGP
ncbi:hypothetical protein L914_00733 [Phytophthora nicotianae]|uniref:Uncharacterized protein n=1 Tax=Phytophthora nicotianae TaxID=4792 RepID=W2P5Q9_PHYNI|nr:hypothetical protein L914_00733 [Phytophthora nicotianae]